MKTILNIHHLTTESWYGWVETVANFRNERMQFFIWVRIAPADDYNTTNIIIIFIYLFCRAYVVIFTSSCYTRLNRWDAVINNAQNKHLVSMGERSIYAIYDAHRPHTKQSIDEWVSMHDCECFMLTSAGRWRLEYAIVLDVFVLDGKRHRVYWLYTSL